MISTPHPIFDAGRSAYHAMFRWARYRPFMPSDDFGNPTLTDRQLRGKARLEREAKAYADHVFEQDHKAMFEVIGCTNSSTSRAVIYALEACQVMMGGNDTVALRLLGLATRELLDKGDHPELKETVADWAERRGG